MSVRKNQYDQELRSFVPVGKIMAALFSRKWGIRLFNAGIRSLNGKSIKGLDCEERYIPSRHGGADIQA
ncbi:MAG: hypothetical protein AAF587_22540 [Bacteroidota bacterium]